MLGSRFRNFDWALFLATLPLVAAGLVTMYSFTGENRYFDRQIIWLGVSVAAFFVFAAIDYRFLRKTNAIIAGYLGLAGVLLSLFLVGSVFKGAQSWIDLGVFAVQPADPMKLVVVLLLAKYFSRRHVEIARFKHIFISGAYAMLPFLLVLLQPDFGSAIIIFLIWFGMTIVSGISKKHLFLVLATGALAFSFLWLFVFAPYQKQRILTFVHPLTDIRGAGYNAYQSAIAVGSGGFWGKGIGEGTQSRLKFLPEYQTDFIFASYAEEWGFAGVALLFLCYGVLFWRILANAIVGASNFETLFAIGLAIFFMTQCTIHIGMNIGLLPVTGQTLPFMSYGGSHLLTEFIGLGILVGMRRYAHDAHRDSMKNEFLGI